MGWVLVLALVTLLGQPAAHGDSGGPMPERSYTSKNGTFELTVDPRWSEDYSESEPLLTLSRGRKTLWTRTAKDFEEFQFPLHACVSDDGKYLVFGGHSVHNLGHYGRGLSFYDAQGQLIRFINRRDLPPGPKSISTSHWYDEYRTHIDGHRLFFFTVDNEEPMLFDIRSGNVLEGTLVEGQGIDTRDDWLRDMEQLVPKSDPDS